MWQLKLQALFKYFGVEVRRAAKGGSYTPQLPFGYSTYSPWFESPFRETFESIKAHTLITEDRCYLLHHLSRYAVSLPGDVAECGVYKGGSALLLARSMGGAGVGKAKRLHLFDTWTGLPKPGAGSVHKEGQFGDVDLGRVRALFEEFSFIDFHPGLMPGSFDAVGERSFCFVHIDVDLYQSALDCCEFFYSRMVPGGVLLFDDYGLPAYRDDAKRGVDQFFAGKPDQPIALASGQCLVLKGH